VKRSYVSTLFLKRFEFLDFISFKILGEMDINDLLKHFYILLILICSKTSRAEKKERYRRESAITGKNLSGPFLVFCKIGPLVGMLELLLWMNQFFSFQLFIFRRLYFFTAGSFMGRNKFTFFLNIVCKVDALMFLNATKSFLIQCR
jgi:hypothetical protein